MKISIYAIKNGVKNLITWFPVIWNDRQWDHYYFYKLLHKKLTLMEKFYRIDAHYVDCEKDADQMQRCVDYLNRLIDDGYHEEAFSAHDIKWGPSEINCGEPNENGSRTVEVTHKNVITAEDAEKECVEFKECIKKESELRTKDIDNLFDIIKNNVERWWD